MNVRGYHKVAPLGSGGSSDVFAAVDDRGREVVLKVVSADYRARAEAEVRVLGAVGTLGPNLYESGETDDGQPFLALERIAGDSLADIATEHSKLADVAVLAPLAELIDSIHGRGVVHRDLKPAHFLWRSSGEPVLIDFGLAIFEGAVLTPADPRTTKVGAVGTVAYMAPEQLRGDLGTAAIDRYAFGAIAYEFMTGALPFTGTPGQIRRGHLTRRPPNLSDSIGASAEADAVFAKALAKDPRARFSTAVAFVEALASAETDTRAKRHDVGGPAAKTPMIAFTPKGSLGALRAAIGDRATIAVLERDLAIAVVANVSGAAASMRTALEVAESIDVGEFAKAGIQLHVAEIRLSGEGRARAQGRALRTRDWLRLPPKGVVLSKSAADVLPASDVEALEDGATFRVLSHLGPSDIGNPRTIGRDSLLEEAANALRNASSMVTLIGEPGIGKSRIARELVDRLSQGQPAWLLEASLTAGEPLALERMLAQRCRETEVIATSFSDAEQLASALGESARSLGGLAVVVDDAHLASSVVLEALELAVMDSANGISVCVCARSNLKKLRPSWGHRAEHALERSIAPIDHRDAIDLVRELLVAVEFVPEDVLDGLATKGAGSPLQLVLLVESLFSAGLIRRVGGGKSARISLEAVRHASSAGSVLAQNALRGLSPGLGELLRLCATLGEPLDAKWLATNQAFADDGERDVGAVDVGYGLRALTEQGLLERTEAGVRFRHPLVGDAIAATVAPDRVQSIHASALALLDHEDDSDMNLARVARHASLARDHETARSAYETLASRHLERLAYVEAESFASLALEHVGDAVAMERRLRTQRALVRTKLGRFPSALEDLGRAKAIAFSMSDQHELLTLAIAESSVLDWMLDAPASIECVEEIERLAGHAKDVDLGKIALARGRALFRQDQPQEASAVLGNAVALASTHGDYDTEISARALLGNALLFAGKADEAAASIEESLAVAIRRGDLLHESVLLSNRMLLWMERGLRDEAEEGLRRAVEIGRRLGNVQIEWCSLHNLAESLHFGGRPKDALPLVRRAFRLQTQFDAGAEVPDNGILLARVLLALGEEDRARREVEGLRVRCPKEAFGESNKILATMVELSCGQADDSGWNVLFSAREKLASADERVELCVEAARSLVRGGYLDEALRWKAQAEEDVANTPHWRQRLWQSVPQ